MITEKADEHQLVWNSESAYYNSTVIGPSYAVLLVLHESLVPLPNDTRLDVFLYFASLPFPLAY